MEPSISQVFEPVCVRDLILCEYTAFHLASIDYCIILRAACYATGTQTCIVTGFITASWLLLTETQHFSNALRISAHMIVLVITTVIGIRDASHQAVGLTPRRRFELFKKELCP
jgi:hypothetical protein